MLNAFGAFGLHLLLHPALKLLLLAPARYYRLAGTLELLAKLVDLREQLLLLLALDK